ncbi:MAG: YkgJ family cysteine cluster protein [Magnetovibrio sp.]|nr:YkgJ family cysteine cluster protein [Magnetovibrio sp.]
MERHFKCTACGKCCQGWLPLSIEDALTHADRFPLFMMWSPVRPGGKSYDLTAELGLTFEPKKRKRAALRITPFSYIPSSIPCPALLPDGKCGVHETKPQRCKTMPLSGARAEDDQTDLMIPKPGWECDISTDAPLVYRDKTVIERSEFTAERSALKADSPVLKAYGDFMLAGNPKLRQEVTKMALNPRGGHVIVNFSTLTPRLPQVDMFSFAAQQFPVMRAFAELTAGEGSMTKEHKRYRACADEYQRMLDSQS